MPILFDSVLPALSATEEWSRAERVAIVVRPLVGFALLSLVYAIVRRTPWPRPFRLRFAALHATAAVSLSAMWLAGSFSIETVVVGTRVGPWYAEEFFLMGTLAYMLFAGYAYAVEGTARAARAEALAARTQLSTLRAQLHPHFLFNALHTVVQLIPVNPALAMEAAELVAGLLRSALEESRDEVPLADEWRFVSRYLAVERIRFGDRLVVRDDMASTVLQDAVPAFALQSLVENAVRHGAAPRVAATEIVVRAAVDGTDLRVSVRNDGVGRAEGTDELSPDQRAGTGTGLARLREQLTVLYGGGAQLHHGPDADGGYEAVLILPRRQHAVS